MMIFLIISPPMLFQMFLTIPQLNQGFYEDHRFNFSGVHCIVCIELILILISIVQSNNQQSISKKLHFAGFCPGAYDSSS